MPICIHCGAGFTHRCDKCAWRDEHRGKSYVAFSTAPGFPLIDPRNRRCAALVLAAPGSSFALSQCDKLAITGLPLCPACFFTGQYRIKAKL